jgi:hypothetical protein
VKQQQQQQQQDPARSTSVPPRPGSSSGRAVAALHQQQQQPLPPRPPLSELQLLCDAASADPIASPLQEPLKVLMAAVEEWREKGRRCDFSAVWRLRAVLCCCLLGALEMPFSTPMCSAYLIAPTCNRTPSSQHQPK